MALANSSGEVVGTEPMGELIGTWSEPEAGEQWMHVASSPMLFHHTSPLEALNDINVGSHAVVIGGYPSCQEHSAIYADELDEDRVILRFAVEWEAEMVPCEWSPWTVDA